MKYQKKIEKELAHLQLTFTKEDTPEEIDAEQYDPSNPHIPKGIRLWEHEKENYGGKGREYVEFIEGQFPIKPYDWVIYNEHKIPINIVPDTIFRSIYDVRGKERNTIQVKSYDITPDSLKLSSYAQERGK